MSGSILPPLPYTPKERGAIQLDMDDVKSTKNPETQEIEHSILFGIPGIDAEVNNYHGNLEACTEVINLLHSGKIKLGYKTLHPSSIHSDSRTSLEILFTEASLQSIPER